MIKHVRWLFRVAFIALIAFEIANYVHVFNFTLDYTWFGLLITSLAVFGGIEIVAYGVERQQEELHWSVWALAFLWISVDASGDFFHLYNRLPWYDQVAHFVGAMVALVAFLSIYKAIEKAHHLKYPPYVDVLLAHGSVMTFGVLYEIEEYLEDYFNLSKRLGDGPDTANDLLMNLLGATAVALFILVVRKLRKRKPRRR